MLGNRRITTKRTKKATDENPTSKASAGIAAAKAVVQSAARSALGDVSNNRKGLEGKAGLKGKAIVDVVEKPTATAHRRAGSASSVAQRPVASRLSIGTRPPIRPHARSQSVVVGVSQNANGAPVRPLPARARPVVAPQPVAVEKTEDHVMDIADDEQVIETDIEDAREVMDELEENNEEEVYDHVEPHHAHNELPHEVEEVDEDDWTMASPASNARYQAVIEQVKAAFTDEVDEFDMTMVSEYADEIFEYMGKLEGQTMANPNYMDGQTEIKWPMRKTLIDWLLQVHLRYHMLPETLWIAVNLIDRFLSCRVVSLVKLQLVGVTAMFIASKYEEIMAPSVEEFAFMTENGYTREEILKGEKIILQTLDFNISPYCSPYSWVRRISKADDYDIQTRTLCKFLMEVTLLDHRFLRAKPSLIAAVGMYTSKRMLSGVWDDAFVFYSDFTEEQLIPGFHLILENLVEPGFENDFVCKKYSNKKFLKASLFARDWAINFLQQHGAPV